MDAPRTRFYSPDSRLAVAGRKIKAAERHEARAAEYRADALALQELVWSEQQQEAS